MPPEVAVQVLREAQREFARALRTEALPTRRSALFVDAPPIAAAERVGVYRNNARLFFRAALALTYPVLLRRVGEDYFRQLAHAYREAHPSRGGDLHWVGAAFPGWLGTKLQQGDYAWLADLARLEWACEEAAAAAAEPAASIEALGTWAPEALDDARLRFQPSLQLVESAWPVWSVWQANQGDDVAAPVDFAIGSQCCACACLDDRMVVYRLEAGDYAVLSALHAGATFAEALAQGRASPDALARVLGWAFAAGLVVAVTGASPSAPA